MAGRVLVVGSVNVDLVVRAPRLPRPGETITGGSFERHAGGKGANQAVAVARLGRPTLFVGAVGDDVFGADARAALVGEHVDVSGLRVVRGIPTGVAAILVGEGGENLISVASGANAELDAASVRDSLRRLGRLEGDVVLVSNEIPLDAVREALGTARAAGARTVLNPAPAIGLDRSVVGLADIVTPNRSELAALAATEATRTGHRGGPPTDVERAAATLIAPGPGGPGPREGILVTLGASGALLVEAGEGAVHATAIAPHPVEAIDTTGAGDAFAGALAAALAEGRPLAEAAHRAAVAGALATTRVGARSGMPTGAELEAALAG